MATDNTSSQWAAGPLTPITWNYVQHRLYFSGHTMADFLLHLRSTRLLSTEVFSSSNLLEYAEGN